MQTPPREVRKTVTVLFCDVVHSTGLAEGVDPEALRRIMWRFFDGMREVLERHGGTVEKFAGDDVMAVFGVPVVHEDDALRAVRAAAEMREWLGHLNDELERAWAVRLAIRIGINTGEVVAGEPSTGQTFVSGEPVVLAKRLQQAAGPGDILIGTATYPLVKHAVEAGPAERFPAKGKRDEVERRRVDAVDHEAPGVLRRLDVPMVGRQAELALLQESFERAVDEQSCRLFTILGPAGIGKSRLAAELSASVGDRAATVGGRCLPYGEGITYSPLSEMVRGLGGLDGLREALAGEDDTDVLIGLVGGAIGATGTAGTNEETFWAVRRVFQALACRRPLIVCLEDIHWAEATFLDLIEYVLGWSRGAPILLLCLARPDLVEKRPAWVAPRPNADAVALEPLSRQEAEALLERLGGDAELSSDVRDRIAQAAEGNPLFVEQMAAMAVDRNVAGELQIPPSIHALLAERLDLLSPDERAVIERASVIGRHFSLDAVAQLTPADARETLTRHLLALVRKELVHPDTSPPSSEDRFRFHHVLVRDTAYHAIPKELRADLHGRLADWVEGHGAGQELEELAGYHLEQAYQARAELGMLDTKTGELGERASKLLASAGRRALDPGDMRAAAALFGRASALLPPEHPERLALAPHHATALMANGELTRADELLANAIEIATTVGERGVRARALIVRSNVRFATHPHDAIAEVEAVADEAIQTFDELGDEIGLAQAWRLLAYADATRGFWAAAADRLQRALTHAERDGDWREQANILGWLPLAFYYGPEPAEEAIRRCEEIRVRARGDRVLEIQVAALLAPLLAMRGRFEEARALAQQSTALLEDLGALTWLASARAHAAQVEVLADRPEEAEPELRKAYETFDRIGDQVNAAAAAALLADALEAQGRHAEADRWTELVDEKALADDVLARVAWGAARAKALARAGRFVEAERLARQTSEVARETDALNMRGDAALGLAAVLRQAGSKAEAAAAAEEALGLYSEKGNLPAAAKAEQLLGELRSITPVATPVDRPTLGLPGA